MRATVVGRSPARVIGSTGHWAPVVSRWLFSKNICIGPVFGCCGAVVATRRCGPAVARLWLFVLAWVALASRAVILSVGERLPAWVSRNFSLEAAAVT